MGSVLATQDGLTDMQSRFADEYPIDFNATRAAERAGYGSPSRRGWELTRNAKVAAVIRERGGVTAADVGLSRRYLLTKAKEILERTLMASPKMIGYEKPVLARDENGNVLYEWQPNAAVAALTLIAKLRGDLTKKVEVDTRSVHLMINGVDPRNLT